MFSKYGFKKATGTFTDVNVFKPLAPTVNMVNLSIGYHNAHSDDEYLNIKDFQYIVDCVQDFLETHKDYIPDDTPEDEKPNRLGGYYGGGYTRYNSYGTGMHGNDYLYDDDWFVCDWCDAVIKDDEGIQTDLGVFCCEECKKQAYKSLVNNDEQ
jgi:hypothetical protein